MLHVLDATVLIDYLRGRPAVDRVAALRAQGDQAATTAINVEEIVRGLREPEQEAAERGVMLWQADCLIAAAASRAGAVLVTGNPEDFPMPELRVEHWPVGE